ncbi:MAG: hypothetical protein U0269_16770 [Polyangiales bacterium]
MNRSDHVTLFVLAALLSGCVTDALAQPRRTPSNGRADAGADASVRSASAQCTNDSQCGWDDPCLPTVCVPRGQRRPAACDESAPEPGQCRCIFGACTLHRHELDATRSPERGCRSSADCDLERNTGVCRVRAATLAPPVNVGDRFCDCDAATSACVLRVYESVPCDSWRDCSWTRSPLRAVSSRQVRRPVNRPVRACRDGELDSYCFRGACRIVTWDC